MKILKSNSIKKLMACVMAFVLSFGIISSMQVLAAENVETVTPKSVHVIYPEEGSATTSGYLKGTRTLTFVIPATRTYKVSHMFESENGADGLMSFKGQSTDTGITLFNNVPTVQNVYLTAGTYTVTIKLSYGYSYYSYAFDLFYE